MRPTPPCGTDAAYARHRRYGEVPCKACCAAHSQHSQASANARQKALSRLSHAHPEEYRRYYLQALKDPA